MNNPYENALKQIKESISHMNSENINLYERIKNPDRILEISIPVKMDNWEIKTFKWYRSQHLDINWPYKWGIRFHQNVDKDEVKALSIWMTIKTQVIWLPLWGWKWWIIVNPKELSEWELERLSRWFVQKIYKYIWPGLDVPAPDVNTNPKIMSYMMDEYSRLVWKYSPWSFTWKLMEVWGSEGRWEATAKWWVIVLDNILKLNWEEIDWKNVVIQWAWNAWLTAWKLLKEKWAKITAISDSKWWIYNENWIDLEEIQKLKNEKKSVTEYKNWKKISWKEILELKTDILVPAALENVITSENMKNISAKIILELANWPTTKSADEYLFSKWVLIIPDILANAWGVTVSYFEQVQNDANYYWSKSDVDERLFEKMQKASTEVYEKSQQTKTSLRNSSYIIALERIQKALIARWEL